jgi:hypothetical protein
LLGDFVCLDFVCFVFTMKEYSLIPCNS